MNPIPIIAILGALYASKSSERAASSFAKDAEKFYPRKRKSSAVSPMTKVSAMMAVVMTNLVASFDEERKIPLQAFDETVDFAVEGTRTPGMSASGSRPGIDTQPDVAVRFQGRHLSLSRAGAFAMKIEVIDNGYPMAMDRRKPLILDFTIQPSWQRQERGTPSFKRMREAMEEKSKSGYEGGEAVRGQRENQMTIVTMHVSMGDVVGDPWWYQDNPAYKKLAKSRSSIMGAYKKETKAIEHRLLVSEGYAGLEVYDYMPTRTVKKLESVDGAMMRFRVMSEIIHTALQFFARSYYDKLKYREERRMTWTLSASDTDPGFQPETKY